MLSGGGDMKRWAVALMLCGFLAVPALCFAVGKGSGTVAVKPDQVVSGNYRVYDSKGNLKETLKPDPVVPGQYRIEDKDGKPAGFIKPDPLVPGGYRGTPAPKKGEKE
jgi:hypothetical protein